MIPFLIYFLCFSGRGGGGGFTFPFVALDKYVCCKRSNYIFEKLKSYLFLLLREQNYDAEYRRNNDYRVNSAGYSAYEYSSPRRSDRNDIGKNSNKKERLRRRDETTFGTPIDDDMLTTEFDFEKNLALFDKQVRLSSQLSSVLMQNDLLLIFLLLLL